LTRLVVDASVSPDYAAPSEGLGACARLVRLPCGPRRYLRKESLWNHLDQLVARSLGYLRQQPRLPDVIHSHYADAGYVGVQLSQLLGIPLLHTGHSLGRCKRQRLLDHWRKARMIDRQFNFDRRIAAEEAVLEHAVRVVTSTAQEGREQYGLYDHHQPAHMVVIPPGTDTSRFAPPGRAPIPPHVPMLVDRFFAQPKKPLILAICRPDVRKNLQRLVAAYGESPSCAPAPTSPSWPATVTTSAAWTRPRRTYCRLCCSTSIATISGAAWRCPNSISRTIFPRFTGWRHNAGGCSSTRR